MTARHGRRAVSAAAPRPISVARSSPNHHPRMSRPATTTEISIFRPMLVALQPTIFHHPPVRPSSWPGPVVSSFGSVLELVCPKPPPAQRRFAVAHVTPLGVSRVYDPSLAVSCLARSASSLPSPYPTLPYPGPRGMSNNIMSQSHLSAMCLSTVCPLIMHS